MSGMGAGLMCQLLQNDLVWEIFCCRPGRLVQFTVGGGDLHLDCGELVSADLTLIGPANQRRGHADLSSKVCGLMEEPWAVCSHPAKD